MVPLAHSWLFNHFLDGFNWNGMIDGAGVHSPQRGLIGPQSWVPHLDAVAVTLVNGTSSPGSIDLISTLYNTTNVHNNSKYLYVLYCFYLLVIMGNVDVITVMAKRSVIQFFKTDKKTRSKNQWQYSLCPHILNELNVCILWFCSTWMLASIIAQQRIVPIDIHFKWKENESVPVSVHSLNTRSWEHSCPQSLKDNCRSKKIWK